MPIDPSIALSAKPIQLANPLEQFGQFQQIQGAMNQNRLADLAYGQQQRDIESNNVLAQLISSGKSGADVAQGLAAQGFGKQAQAYATQQQERDYKAAQTGELKSKTAKSDYDLTEAKRQKAVTDIAALTSPDQAHASLNAHVQAGDLTPEMAAAVRQTIPQNPADFPKWQIGMLQRIMAPKEAAAYMAPDANTVANNKTSVLTTGMNNATSIKTAGMNNATSIANNAATVEATKRGQDMQNERMKEANANKPLTEFQGKSAAFADRAQKAGAILDQLETKYNPAAINSKNSVQDWPVIGGALGAITNSSLSANDQKAEQAQRDFVNAILRQESGAAIGASEFQNAARQYFPQPGDSKAVIAQKAANRKTAIQGLVRNAGANAGLSAPMTNTLPSGWSVEAH